MNANEQGWPLWLAQFGDTILPIPFVRPVCRLEVVDLCSEASDVAPVNWMDAWQAHQIANLLLHFQSYGSPTQRALACAVGLQDPQLALARLWEISHPRLH